MRLLFRNYCYDYDYCYDDHQEKTIWHWQLDGRCTACVGMHVCALCPSFYVYAATLEASSTGWPASHFCFTTIVAVLQECEKEEKSGCSC